MTLNFPNNSRCYDARRHLIHFWGYDSALEVSFFIEVGALYKINPQTKDTEADYLKSFDAMRDRIEEAACKHYARGHRDTYLLAATDF